MDKKKTQERFLSSFIIFNVSSYLLGEYVLRIFPLVCKAMHSARFSLNLLTTGKDGEDGEDGGGDQWEGPIHGKYFNTQLQNKHHIRGLVLNYPASQLQLKLLNNHVQPPSHSPTTFRNNNSRLAVTVKHLYVHMNKHPEIVSILFFSLVRSFPNLTAIVIDLHDLEMELHYILKTLWRIPLNSLVVEQTVGFSKCIRPGSFLDPPAFNQTLRRLKLGGEELALLLSYCHHLQTIEYTHSVQMVMPALDLSKQADLQTLVLEGGRETQGVCPKLTELSIANNFSPLHPQSVIEFISHCPLLQLVSLKGVANQLTVTKAIINPHRCVLKLDPDQLKSDDLCELMQSGFTLHPDMLDQLKSDDLCRPTTDRCEN